MLLKTNRSRKKSQEKFENTVRQMEMETREPTPAKQSCGESRATDAVKRRASSQEPHSQLRKLNNSKLNPNQQEEKGSKDQSRNK